MAGVIDSYLCELDRRLAFDRALGARVCAEVEDHLREAAAAHPGHSDDEAERRAVERFGPAREIAARFADDILAGTARWTWYSLTTAVACALLAMRLRRMLLDDAAFSAAPLAAFLDRYAFIAAIVCGIAACLVWRAALRSGGAVHARLPARLALGAFAGLALSIAGGAFIAAAQPSPPTLAAFLLEIAMAGWLALQAVTLRRRTGAALKALAP
ncbi:MAG: hypothetical protein QM698_14695 [Micropepsaceae bacterium]